MSTKAGAERLSAQLDDELTDALIIGCRLSDEQVALIRELMSTRTLSFVEAALQLDLITINEAAQALEWAKRSNARTGSSVIETALRRHYSGRTVATQHSVNVKPSPDLLLVCEADNPNSERLRALRTELLLLLGRAAHQSNAVALLSPGAGEGRSQLSAELAISFAQLGRRTLLIEADLRQPRQHLLFGAANAAGITKWLTLDETPQLIGVDGLPQLSLLLSGPVTPNPLELLSDGRFARMLQDWRRIFDVLVIDTPALTKFADGLAIASMAEQVLLISRANISSHKDMKDTLRRLASTEARILGAVINYF